MVIDITLPWSLSPWIRKQRLTGNHEGNQGDDRGRHGDAEAVTKDYIAVTRVRVVRSL